MAKGDPNSVTVQYKVHLKPTEIGRLVIERLARPHVDVSPELRRFIELGYAAERAGFILDGTVLRHAGRMWDTQPNVADLAQDETGLAGEKPAARRQGPQAPRSPKPSVGSQSPVPGEADPVPPAESTNANPSAAPSLRDKLRGLSG